MTDLSTDNQGQASNQSLVLPESSSPSLPPQLELWEGSSAAVEQGRHWSSALIWLSTATFAAVLLWAFTARFDQTISVRGRLEPSGSVRDVDSPSAGVVSEVFVKDGQQVKQGQPLLSVEAKGLASRRQAITTTTQLFELQALALQGVLRSGGDPRKLPPLPSLPQVSNPALAAQLLTARQQVQQIRSQLDQLSTRLSSRRETLALQQRIASDMRPLYEGGGMARNQYLTTLNQVQESRAEVATLEEERNRVIGQAAAQLNEINRQLISLRSELVGLKETLSYRTIKAPVSGQVFDARVSRYSVVNSGQQLLKIVPLNALQARVEVSNADIGFLKSGMHVNVSVDSFPSGEFGYIQGTLESIGSDVLPPDSSNQQYRFPALVSLKQQEVESGGRPLNLQSGMGVTANIRLRSRPVVTVVTDMFTKQLEGVKRFR